MDFFERQQIARRNTRVMVVCFALAVICIIAAIDFVVAAAWLSANPEVLARQARPGVAGALALVPKGIYVLATLGTAGAIFAVSAWEIMMLRSGGGAAVAKMVGARRVEPSSRDPLERRLLNVVEEMAIAAGTRVPAVYVMDEEQGINAFAAGYDVSHTVIAVTRGTLETLNRDELQGVIGHEFSHIVNGDMALNIRMIGVLAGIVFLGAVGGFLLRTTRGKSKDTGWIFIIGVGLYVIGYIGLFFARIIKATVARQREFLADSASVQFTRNPDGLAGALDQIRASGRNSLIGHRHAEDVSHLFFGQGISMGLQGLFATHPPLEERIQRVNPRFQPQGYRGKRPPATEVSVEAPEAALGLAGGPAAAGEGQAAQARASDTSQAWGRSPGESADLVGSVDNQKMDTARRILAKIPDAVRERIRDPQGAAATLVALLLANNDTVMDEQIVATKTAGVGALGEAARAYAKEMRVVTPAYYLPLVDLALPALKLASAQAKYELLTALQAVIHADRRVSVFEFVLFTLVRAQLAKGAGSAPPRYRSIAQARDEVVFLLSLVAQAGLQRGPKAEEQLEVAFRAGAALLDLNDAKPTQRGLLGMEEAGAVLDKLRDLAPMQKAVLVKALFATVTSDGTIRLIEAALMRTVGAVLDCPLPPLIEDLDPEALAP